ncbi:hypothetical protein BJY16_000545 [Actinoplanes octamycinicus]|uniref:Uncharacterized protein n=1 Tax=Actinoplanes octamycinicus TaxID=135948 RepID=A0A7W7M4X2_9ACTN|nr:hypothetical protein [Actinoplanes octamycinicus]MBB4737086.1 hypothetical protein [Actinoplanes octamycinicus]GIE63365.1 hypothetical protein Aoc01nite_87670 [Actinoplanes octamycinicus]
MSDPQLRQNDPDRAGGLISDAQGEFVQQHPGGAFDPRTFRHGGRPADEPVDDSDDAVEPDEAETPRPPMSGERMSSPGREIDKAG